MQALNSSWFRYSIRQYTDSTKSEDVGAERGGITVCHSLWYLLSHTFPEYAACSYKPSPETNLPLSPISPFEVQDNGDAIILDLLLFTFESQTKLSSFYSISRLYIICTLTAAISIRNYQSPGKPFIFG
jgi:hypothetical protein